MAPAAQAQAWAAIADGNNTLVIAPTGSGKTLAAFLWAIDRLAATPPETPKPGTRVLYVSPLKALAVDVERNLRSPLDIANNLLQGDLNGAEVATKRFLINTTAGVGGVMDIAADNGLTALPSATNFVAIDCRRDGAFARALLDALAVRGIFARMPGVAPMDRCIRVSCGPAEELDAFAGALPAALRAIL